MRTGPLYLHEEGSVEGHGSKNPSLTPSYTNYIFLYYRGPIHKTGTGSATSAV